MGFATRSFIILLAAGTVLASRPAWPAVDAAPARLSETGLYVPGTKRIDPSLVSFRPQYPLWSDGATKRRWLFIPPGTSIDAAGPGGWDFPVGTRLWKEFSYGLPVETRLIERLADGTWRYVAYVWRPDLGDALLAPADGIADLAVPTTPGGRYTIPSEDDCRACHEGPAVPVLGLSALQLSADRDPLVRHLDEIDPNELDLVALHEAGLIRNLPAALLDTPPRIDSASATERAALGYLHANCGHCHNADGALALLEMTLHVDSSVAEVRRTLTGVKSDFRMHGFDRRIVPGLPHASVLALRMRSREPLEQMPPLGTRFKDDEGIALVERWIREDLILAQGEANDEIDQSN